jgi:hypothetical protein
MAGNTVGANDSFVFKTGKQVHLFAQFVRPFRRFDAMQQNEVKVICADLFEETLHDDIGVRPFGVGNASRPKPNFADF